MCHDDSGKENELVLLVMLRLGCHHCDSTSKLMKSKQPIIAYTVYIYTDSNTIVASWQCEMENGSEMSIFHCTGIGSILGGVSMTSTRLP